MVRTLDETLTTSSPEEVVNSILYFIETTTYRKGLEEIFEKLAEILPVDVTLTLHLNIHSLSKECINIEKSNIHAYISDDL